MSSDNVPFSVAMVMEQCGGNKAIALAILEEFLSQVPTDVSEMESCLAGGDLIQAGKVAHRLKGTAGVMGAKPLHPLCSDMEINCKAGDSAKAATIYAELKAEAQRCVDFVPEATKLLG